MAHRRHDLAPKIVASFDTRSAATARLQELRSGELDADPEAVCPCGDASRARVARYSTAVARPRTFHAGARLSHATHAAGWYAATSRPSGSPASLCALQSPSTLSAPQATCQASRPRHTTQRSAVVLTGFWQSAATENVVSLRDLL